MYSSPQQRFGHLVNERPFAEMGPSAPESQHTTGDRS